MANTEIRNALKYVRDAEDAVETALEEKPSKSEKEQLRKAWDTLCDADDLLVALHLAAQVGQLEKQSKKLAAVNEDVKKAIGHLKSVAKTIDKAAKAVDALVTVAKILISVGLV